MGPAKFSGEGNTIPSHSAAQTECDALRKHRERILGLSRNEVFERSYQVSFLLREHGSQIDEDSFGLYSCQDGRCVVPEVRFYLTGGA